MGRVLETARAAVGTYTSHVAALITAHGLPDMLFASTASRDSIPAKPASAWRNNRVITLTEVFLFDNTGHYRVLDVCARSADMPAGLCCSVGNAGKGKERDEREEGKKEEREEGTTVNFTTCSSCNIHTNGGSRAHARTRTVLLSLPRMIVDRHSRQKSYACTMPKQH